MTGRSEATGTARVQIPARLLDLSLGGALLSLEASLEEGTIYDFALDLGHRETVWVQAEVRRCRPSDRGGYQVGVEFVGVDPHDAQRLREYLARRR